MRSILLLDPAGRAFALKEKILYFGIGAFFISFLLPDMPVINNIVTGGILLNCFLYNSPAEKKQLLWKRKDIALMILFYGLHIISAFLSADRQEALEMLVLRVPLLAFPLSIGLIYIRPAVKDRILLFFSIIITLTALVCLVYAFQQYRIFHDTGLLYDDSLTAATRKQSIYIALLVNLALYSYVYLLQKQSFVVKYPALAYLAIAFLLVFHFLLASRIAIIILYTSLFVFAAVYIVKKRKYLEGATLVMGLFIGAILLVKFFPKTLNRFKELNYTGYQFNSHAVESHYNMQLTADQWNGANIRLAVWKCGWELAGRHWLTGVPLGDKELKLMEVFKEKQFDFAYQSRRNMHSTYLDVLCNFGVIGLGIFLLGYLVIPLITCYRAGDGLGAFIILTLGASMITETYPDRSIGCLFLGFFLCFAAAWKMPPVRDAAY
ncbi:MAG TPA: O-antigen ligase family protein [Puia sp.]|nr:O-antigen ligase family protein [Puia sp.]